MIKGKVLRGFFSAIAVMAVSLAAISASTSFPFFTYQPKAPKSLIKSD